MHMGIIAQLVAELAGLFDEVLQWSARRGMWAPCREAGARDKTNVFLRDLNVTGVRPLCLLTGLMAM